MKLSRPGKYLISVILLAYALKLALTPDAWSALKDQTHMPSRIGTAPFDTVVTVAGNIALLAIMTIISFTIGQALSSSRILTDISEDLAETIMYHTRHRKRAEESYRKVLNDRITKMALDDNERVLFDLIEPYRESIVDKAVSLWQDRGTARSKLIVLMDAARTIPGINNRVTQVTWDGTRSLMYSGIAQIAERLGGHMTASTTFVAYIVWDRPITAYQRTQLRLYTTALELVTCSQAGEKAESIHKRLVDECQLASYQGFVLGGSDQPLDIEKAVITECRDITSIDVMISAPDFEKDSYESRR